MLSTLTKEQMDRMIDEHFEYEGNDDVDGVLSTLAEDVDHDVVGSPLGPLSKRENVRDLYEQLFSDLKQEKVTSLKRYYGDGFVVDESLWEGVAVGNPLGVPGGGKKMEFRLLHIFEFDGSGQITRENVWPDYSAMMRQLT